MGTRVAMVGCGAVGGHVAGHIARAGEDIVLIDPWPEHVDKMNKDGLLLTGVTEQERALVKVNAIHVTEVQSLIREKPIDIAFISTKSYDTQWAAHLIKPYLAPEGFCVSLQNCINEENLAAVVGWGKTVGCIASGISCELVGPAHVQRNVPVRGESYTVFRAGETHGGITDRVKEVARLAGHADSSMATDNLWGQRWSKLVINASHNGLSAATGLSGNEMTTHDVARWVQIRLAAETIQVGQALGYKLEKRKTTLPEDWIKAANGDKAGLKAVEDYLFEEVKTRGTHQRPSMGQDMNKGRRTEIDAINGFVRDKGIEAGVPTPVNTAMWQLVRAVERGEKHPDPDNLAGM